MSERRHPQIVNIDEIEARDEARGDFGFRARRIGQPAGARALGCTHLEVPPGKTAFPYHFHCNFEEALYILEGSGELRLGEATVAVRPGDYVAFPPGPDSAHALTNTGTSPLRYLAMSGPGTPVSLDMVSYPDSKKVGYAAGVDPVKGWRGGAWIMGLVKSDQPRLDYYDGEPKAEPTK